MTKILRHLQSDPDARAILRRAHRRDKRYGSGDQFDFGLFVVDETRQVTRELIRAAVVEAQRHRDGDEAPPCELCAALARLPPSVIAKARRAKRSPR